MDTNFVYRGPGGLRISGGTSIGRSLRDTCRVDGDLGSAGRADQPYKGREGNLYGGGCKIDNPYQLNARASGSYTIPWVDVLMGVAFQSRPGNALAANLQRAVTRGGMGADQRQPHRHAVQRCRRRPRRSTINLLDTGDLYGERQNNWDVTLRKNIRFAGKRLNFGVDIYNCFNSDAAQRLTTRPTRRFAGADGSWAADNPATPQVEVNGWGDITAARQPAVHAVVMSLNF